MVKKSEEKKEPKKAPKKKSPRKSSKKAPVSDISGISKLRIRVKAYENKVLDASVKQIIDTAIRFDAKILGPVPLPTERDKYTVNRSSFIYKNSREQYEMKVHKRMIDILNPSPKVIEALTNISLPSGVSIDVKMM